jgi:hypothetical protein
VIPWNYAFGCGQRIGFTLTINYSGGLSPQIVTFAFATGPAPILISGTLNDAAPVPGPYYSATGGLQKSRLNRDGLVTNFCGPGYVTKPFPGIFGTGNRRFHSYSFVIPANVGPLCVRVTLTNGCTGADRALFAVGYGTFNPDDISQDYRGDPGSSNLAGGQSGFSLVFWTGINEGRITVVVHEVNPDLGLGCPYTLEISGACVPAPPPFIRTGTGIINNSPLFTVTPGKPTPIQFVVFANFSDPMPDPSELVLVTTGTNTCAGTIAAGTCGLVFSTPGFQELYAAYIGNATYAASMGIDHMQVSNWMTYLPLLFKNLVP